MSHSTPPRTLIPRLVFSSRSPALPHPQSDTNVAVTPPVPPSPAESVSAAHFSLQAARALNFSQHEPSGEAVAEDAAVPFVAPQLDDSYSLSSVSLPFFSALKLVKPATSSAKLSLSSPPFKSPPLPSFPSSFNEFDEGTPLPESSDLPAEPSDSTPMKLQTQFDDLSPVTTMQLDQKLVLTTAATTVHLLPRAPASTPRSAGHSSSPHHRHQLVDLADDESDINSDWHGHHFSEASDDESPASAHGDYNEPQFFERLLPNSDDGIYGSIAAAAATYDNCDDKIGDEVEVNEFDETQKMVERRLSAIRDEHVAESGSVHLQSKKKLPAAPICQFIHAANIIPPADSSDERHDSMVESNSTSVTASAAVETVVAHSSTSESESSTSSTFSVGGSIVSRQPPRARSPVVFGAPPNGRDTMIQAMHMNVDLFIDSSVLKTQNRIEFTAFQRIIYFVEQSRNRISQALANPRFIYNVWRGLKVNSVLRSILHIRAIIKYRKWRSVWSLIVWLAVLTASCSLPWQ